MPERRSVVPSKKDGSVLGKRVAGFDKKKLAVEAARRVVYCFPNGRKYWSVVDGVLKYADSHPDQVQRLFSNGEEIAAKVSDSLRGVDAGASVSLEGRLGLVNTPVTAGDVVMIMPESCTPLVGRYGVVERVYGSGMGGGEWIRVAVQEDQSRSVPGESLDVLSSGVRKLVLFEQAREEVKYRGSQMVDTGWFSKLLRGEVNGSKVVKTPPFVVDESTGNSVVSAEYVGRGRRTVRWLARKVSTATGDHIIGMVVLAAGLYLVDCTRDSLPVWYDSLREKEVASRTVQGYLPESFSQPPRIDPTITVSPGVLREEYSPVREKQLRVFLSERSFPCSEEEVLERFLNARERR